MKRLSGAQERALAAMRNNAQGKLEAFKGTTRSTVEALQRKGLVTVETRMAERVTRRRGGGENRKTYVDWTAQLKPVMPTGDQIAELDRLVEAGTAGRPPATPTPEPERPATFPALVSAAPSLSPAQREQAAAYAALVAPSVAITGSNAASPNYSPAVAYTGTLREGDAYVLASYALVRMMTGDIPTPPDPRQVNGEATNIWTITAPGTPTQTGKELARVAGSTQNAAAMAAASILNQRGGFAMRRLGTKEIGAWRKDFRAGGTVLRLSVTEDDAYQVTVVETGDVMVIRNTPEEAERDARADVDSLTSALGR